MNWISVDDGKTQWITLWESFTKYNMKTHKHTDILLKVVFILQLEFLSSDKDEIWTSYIKLLFGMALDAIEIKTNSEVDVPQNKIVIINTLCILNCETIYRNPKDISVL